MSETQTQDEGAKSIKTLVFASLVLSFGASCFVIGFLVGYFFSDLKQVQALEQGRNEF